MVPEVSVIMPAMNVGSYLFDAAQSVLQQTALAVELIIIDDASMDSTGAIAADIASADDRVQVLRSGCNLGSAASRNAGLAKARSRFVAFLDGDDLWVPDKLEKQLSALQQSGAQLCYTAIQKVDIDGRQFGKVQHVPETVTYNELLGNPLIGCSTVLMDYDALGRPLMPDIRKRQDFAFWLQLLRQGARAIGINEPLTYYRVRPGSLSSNKLSAAYYVWRVYRELERLPLHRAVPNFISYAARGFGKRLNR
jgi:teichuronic acid biosynthesis glycosyltransferase TuaG